MAILIKIGDYQNESERWAAEFLEQKLPDDYIIVVGVDVFNDYGFRWDCDQLIIGKYAVYVVEVKGYSGKIKAGENWWAFDGREGFPSPMSLTTKKRNAFYGLLARKKTARSMHTPWCQPVAFLTGDRGGNLEIELERADECIFGPDRIVEGLTNPFFLNAKHKNPLSEAQRELVKRVISQFEHFRKNPLRFGSFGEIQEMGRVGHVRVCTGALELSGFKRKFLLKIAERFDYEMPEAWRIDAQRLAEESKLYHQLAGIPGVPDAAPLIEDDERVISPVSYPRGRMLENFEPGDFEMDRRLEILESIATTLQKVHQRGIIHGGLSPTWVFAAEEGEVELLNFAVSSSDKSEFTAPEVLQGAPAGPAADVYALARILSDWFGRESSGSFELFESVPEAHAELEGWFQGALHVDPAERSTLKDLLLLLRRAEFGTGTITTQPEVVPFEREEGALLHNAYRLEESLGFGPAGEVWRASHARGNYPLALYFVDLEGVSEDWVRSRFEEIAALHHPMMVRALDMRRIPGRDGLYMAADWLDGDPLEAWLEEGKEVSQEQALSWLRDLLVVLEYVHGEQVLHRNITPDAVVIVQGRPRLVEFSLRPEKDSAAGLVEYVDPMVSDLGWRRESDLYSLAATFLPLLAGIMLRTNQGRDVDPEQIRESLPASLPETVRAGFVSVLSPGFHLEEGDYLNLFGLEEFQQQPEQLPIPFFEQLGMRNPEQRYITWYLLREFHGKPGVRARNRMRVAEGALKLMGRLRATEADKTRAKNQINPLINQGFLKTNGRSGPVRPTDELLASWASFISG